MRRAFLLAAVLAGTPWAAHACNVLEWGLGWLDGDGFRYGGLAGITRHDSYGVLGADVCSPRGIAQTRPIYWVLRADHLGLDSRSAAVVIGRQGLFRLDARQQRLPGQRDRGMTPVLGVGSDFLRLPADWVAAPTTAGMRSLLPNLGEVRLGTDRRRSALGLAARLPEPWLLETRLSEDRLSGLRPFAGVIGNNGGNARAILLPAPVEQRSQRFDVALLYAGRTRQFRLGYHLALFDNQQGRLRWTSPYAEVPGWAGSAAQPNGIGQAQPAPDNQFHQLSVALTQALRPQTRFSADLALGRLRQNERFLPYSIDPLLLASAQSGLPRPSLDGRIDTTLLNLRLISRPASGWQWQASYRYDDRDNRTAMAEWLYISADSQVQNSAENSNRRRFNLPYSLRTQRLGVEASRRLSGGWRLQLGAAHRRDQRDFAARRRTDESSLNLRLGGELSARLSGGMRLAVSDRNGDNYIGNRPFLSTYSSGYTSSVAGQFENLPGLRSFPLADRRRSQAHLFLQWLPAEGWSFGAHGSFGDDDYHRSELGLTGAGLSDLQLEAAYASADWTAHAFASREWLSFDQNGRAFQGGANRLAQSQDPARNWRALHRDRVDSAGLGLDRAFAAGRYHLGIDYSWSLARGDVRVFTGPALSSAPLPPTAARLHRLQLDGRWRLREALDLRLALEHERFASRDWAYDGLGPSGLANVILLGENSPDYRASAVSLSLLYRF
jgi:MtrB/PioB family decaheme-associated outer membrane protein